LDVEGERGIVLGVDRQAGWVDMINGRQSRGEGEKKEKMSRE